MNYPNLVVFIPILLLFLLTPFPVQSSDGKGGNDEGYCSANSTGGCGNGTKLVLVQVVFRHGDRTPLFTWPKDPHNPKNSNSSTAQFFQRQGVLTKRGRLQAYELGTALATRYKEFIQNSWIPEDIYAQSSESDRTVMTAQTVLAGLYPPQNCPSKEPGGCESRWSKDIKWQPIPVYTIPKMLDHKINFVLNRKSCPAYGAELKKVLDCQWMREYAKKHQKTFEGLQKHTGLTSVKFKNAGRIYDTLYVQSVNDLALPNWTTTYYPQPLKEMEELGFQVLSSNRKMMRFNGGSLLNEVLDNMKSVVFANCSLKQKTLTRKSVDRSGRQPKIYLFSGHDTTVAAFLATLGLLHQHQPAYTSAVIVELHEPINKKAGGDTRPRTSNYHVKVFYRNASRSPLEELTIPKCGKPCHLDKLEEISSDLFIADWQSECDKIETSWIGWLFKPFTTLFSLLKKLAYWTGLPGGGPKPSCGCKK